MSLKKLVGIKYEADDGAPKIVVKQLGKYAEEIVTERQRASDKRLIEDRELLDRLFQLPLYAEISEDLFQVVAILLVHIYGLDAIEKYDLHESYKRDKNS